MTMDFYLGKLVEVWDIPDARSLGTGRVEHVAAADDGTSPTVLVVRVGVRRFVLDLLDPMRRYCAKWPREDSHAH